MAFSREIAPPQRPVPRSQRMAEWPARARLTEMGGAAPVRKVLID